MADKSLPSIDALRQILNYDPETGEFVWRERTAETCRDGGLGGASGTARMISRRVAGTKAGTVTPRGYRMIQTLGKNMSAHRLAWALHYGLWPIGELDHINGDKDDNRIANLREVDRRENMRNRSMPKTNRSGHPGVIFHSARGKWQASIRVDGKLHYLGIFDDKADAVAARIEAEKQFGFHENHGRRS